MISTDRNIFTTDSPVRARMIEYGALTDELHIVVFTRKEANQELRNKEKIRGNTWVYPTNSFSRWLYILDAIRLGREIIRTYSFARDRALITCQDPFECGLVGILLGKKHTISTQIQIHTDFLSRAFARESVLNRIRLRCADYVIPRASCIRTVSLRIKRGLERFYALQTEPVVLPIFVDVARFQNEIKTEQDKPFPFTILVNSRLESEKNVGLAIRVLAKVKSSMMDVGMVIVGTGTLLSSLEQLTKNLGLENKVIFTGWQTDVVPYYQMADLYLHTSNYEGYGLSLIEAAAARCPILTTNVGIVGELFLGSSVLVCEPRDASCLLEKLQHAIKNRAAISQLALNASEVISVHFRYDKDTYLKKYKASWEACSS